LTGCQRLPPVEQTEQRDLCPRSPRAVDRRPGTGVPARFALRLGVLALAVLSYITARFVGGDRLEEGPRVTIVPVRPRFGLADVQQTTPAYDASPIDRPA
jgi:hypothetical protein